VRLTGRLNRTLEPVREIGLSNASSRPDVRAGGDLVFVGYGIHAPMYSWDDFAGTDLRGKIAVACTTYVMGACVRGDSGRAASVSGAVASSPCCARLGRYGGRAVGERR
jgi:hypothetical protein